MSSATTVPLIQRLKGFLTRLVDLTLGMPSPVGRLRPRAFTALWGMDNQIHKLSDDLRASQASLDFALKKNGLQDEQFQELTRKYKDLHADAVRMSKALKELANHPNVLSPASQDVLRAFKLDTAR